MKGAASEGRVVVHGAASGFAQEVSAGAHRLRCDEPTVSGGTDTGPTPYDLLLAGLGACKSMTMALYARRKAWPLESARVTLRHAKIHAADCSECETKEGLLDRIECEVELRGPLDETQRARLLEIAGRCPVHRTLTSEIVIASRLVASPD